MRVGAGYNQGFALGWIQASFKVLGCLYICRLLTYGSFQLTHMSRSDTLFNWLRHGGQNKDRTFLQRSQHCHKGEFRGYLFTLFD